MAKTSKHTSKLVGRQAAPGVWTPQDLLDAIARPSTEEKLKMLRDVGIVDASGNLAKKYRSSSIVVAPIRAHVCV